MPPQMGKGNMVHADNGLSLTQKNTGPLSLVAVWMDPEWNSQSQKTSIGGYSASGRNLK